MSQQIALQPIAKQQVSVQIGDNRFDMAFKTAGSSLVFDLSINDEVVLLGSRIVAGTPLIPFRASERQAGNFMMVTENNEIPRYQELGVTQFLVYFSEAELVAIRG